MTDYAAEWDSAGCPHAAEIDQYLFDGATHEKALAAIQAATAAAHWHAARAVAERHRFAMRVAMQVAHSQGVPETRIAAVTRTDRYTVRRALGKPRRRKDQP